MRRREYLRALGATAFAPATTTTQKNTEVIGCGEDLEDYLRRAARGEFGPKGMMHGFWATKRFSEISTVQYRGWMRDAERDYLDWVDEQERSR